MRDNGHSTACALGMNAHTSESVTNHVHMWGKKAKRGGGEGGGRAGEEGPELRPGRQRLQ